MNNTLVTDLVYGGVAIVAFALEHMGFLPNGASEVVIALVAGAAYGQARVIINQNMVKASE